MAPFAFRRGVLAAMLPVLASPALAQPMLYEQRLPEGFAFVRIANALPGEAVVRPGFGPEIRLGTEGAARIGDYLAAEDVAGRPVKLVVSEGGQTAEAVLRLQGGGFNTVILERQGGAIAAVAVQDQTEFNQTRARLGFYNATPDCAGASLALEPSGQAVFSQVPPGSMRSRSVNPTQAVVRAACAAGRAPSLDLGRLEAGGQYSVWLMAPEGRPIALLARDRVAPRR